MIKCISVGTILNLNITISNKNNILNVLCAFFWKKNRPWQWQRWAKFQGTATSTSGIFARFVLSLAYYFKSYMCIQCFEITSTSLKSLIKTLVLVCSEIIYLQKKPFQDFLSIRCYKKVHSYPERHYLVDTMANNKYCH